MTVLGYAQKLPVNNISEYGVLLWSLLSIVAKIFNNRIDLVYASLFTAGVLAFHAQCQYCLKICNLHKMAGLLLFSAFAFNPQMSLTGMDRT